MTVSVWEYQYQTFPEAFHVRASTQLRRVGEGGGFLPRLQYPSPAPTSAGGAVPQAVIDVPAGQSGPVAFTVTGFSPGSAFLAFTTDGNPPAPPSTDFRAISDTAFYTGVRVMPADDYTGVPRATRLTWDFLYAEIFRYYYLLFPAMSELIPMNNEGAMRAAAAMLVKLTDPAHWISTKYMPPTRDLSTGKRKLLVEWAKTIPPEG